MEKTNVSWKIAREVLSAIAWRGVILTAVPPFVFGLLIGAFGARDVLESVHPFLFVFFYILWIAYFYWCWLAVFKSVLEKSKLAAGGNTQERGGTSSEKAKPTEARHNWVSFEKFHHLNGWRRLWVLLSILWIVPVGFLTYKQWPHPYSAHVAGCVFPGELFSIAAPKLVREELINWRRELPTELVLKEEELSTTPPRYAYTGDELPGTIPGWNGDRLGRPKWARTPYVKAYCRTLFERLERSGRAVHLREQSADSIFMRRIEWLSLFLAAWIVPVVGIYLLGLAIVWVTRGFRKQT